MSGRKEEKVVKQELIDERFDQDWVDRVSERSSDPTANHYLGEILEIWPVAERLAADPSREAEFAYTVQVGVSSLIELCQSSLLSASASAEYAPKTIRECSVLLECAALELCVFAAAAIKYGGSRQVKTVAIALERLASLNGGHPLERYPALLLLYTVGIAASLKEDADVLLECLIRGEFGVEGDERSCMATQFDVDNVFGDFAHIAPSETAISYLPWHDHLRSWVRPILFVLMNANEKTVQAAAHVFEFLRLLIRLDLEPFVRVHPSCFVYRDVGGQTISAFLQDVARDGEASWIRPLFGSSLERMARALRAFDQANERGELSIGKLFKSQLPLGLASIFAS